MVIILPGQKKSSGWGAIGAGLGKGLGEGIEAAEEKRDMEKYQDQENQAAKKLGINLTGIRDPQTRREILLNGIKSKFKNESENKDLMSNRSIISDLESRRGLESGSLGAYEKDPRMAEQVSRPKAEPRGRISEEPITADQLRRIEEVRKKPEFSTSSPSQKYQLLTSGGVSRANAESESKIAAEEGKVKAENSKVEAKKTQEQNKQEYDEKLRVHKESDEYDKDVLSKARSAKRTLENVKEAEKALASKKVSPNSTINVLRHFGEPGKALSNAIMNKETKAIQALMPEFLEGKKELFGVRLSDADLRLLQDKSIDIGNSLEANKAVLGLIKKYADQSILRGDIASEISKKHGNYRPLGYERMIDEEVDRQMNPIEMMDAKGNSYSIPAYRVGSAIKKGLSVRNE